MRTWILMMLLATVSLVAVPVAWACRCMPPDIIYAYNSADAAMIVVPMRTRTVGQYNVWQARVVRDLKGCRQPGDLVLIGSNVSPAACGTTLTPGQQTVVFADDVQVGGRRQLVTDSCAGNTPLRQLSPSDEQFLRNRPLSCGGGSTCADGNAPFNCLVDPCSVAQSCPGGTCASNYCGGCTAEFYDPAGYGVCTPW